MNACSQITSWRQRCAVLWAGQFLTTLGLMMLVPLMPFYIGRLPGGGAHPDLWTGLALTAPAFTVMLTAPWWGGRSDRWPRRRTVSLAFGLFALSAALMAAGWSVESFVLARLLQGASGMTVVLTACIVAEAPAEYRGRALGTLQSATAAGCVVGPMLGGWMIDHANPALLLWATSGGSALCAAVAWQLLVDGAASGEPRAPIRTRLGELLAAPGLFAVIATGVLTQAAAFAALPAFAALVQGLAPDRAASFVGLAHSAGWCVALMGAPWWGRRNDRGRARSTLLLAAAGCALAVALQPLAPDAHYLIPLRLAQGFFFAGTLQTVFFLINRRVDTAVQGQAVGLANSALTGGQILGPVGAALLLPEYGASAVLWGIAALFLGGALLTVRQSTGRTQPASSSFNT